MLQDIEYYIVTIDITDNKITAATKAILGLVNIDIKIKNAGIGITYGENPVGIKTAIIAINKDKNAAIDKYLGCIKSFSKNFI